MPISRPEFRRIPDFAAIGKSLPRPSLKFLGWNSATTEPGAYSAREYCGGGIFAAVVVYDGSLVGGGGAASQGAYSFAHKAVEDKFFGEGEEDFFSGFLVGGVVVVALAGGFVFES